MVMSQIRISIAQKLRLPETFPNLYKKGIWSTVAISASLTKGLAEVPANSATCHDHFD
jgi:hypothetical protein